MFVCVCVCACVHMPDCVCPTFCLCLGFFSLYPSITISIGNGLVSAFCCRNSYSLINWWCEWASQSMSNWVGCLIITNSSWSLFTPLMDVFSLRSWKTKTQDWDKWPRRKIKPVRCNICRRRRLRKMLIKCVNNYHTRGIWSWTLFK